MFLEYLSLLFNTVATTASFCSYILSFAYIYAENLNQLYGYKIGLTISTITTIIMTAVTIALIRKCNFNKIRYISMIIYSILQSIAITTSLYPLIMCSSGVISACYSRILILPIFGALLFTAMSICMIVNIALDIRDYFRAKKTSFVILSSDEEELIELDSAY